MNSVRIEVENSFQLIENGLITTDFIFEKRFIQSFC